MGWLNRKKGVAVNGAAGSGDAGSKHADMWDPLLDEGFRQSQSNFVSPQLSAQGSFTTDEEQRYILRRIKNNPMWTLDRGTGFYQQERLTKKKASLLGSGRYAGKSKVLYYGIEWTRILRHVWKRDFFTTAIHSRFPILVLAMLLVFISSFLVWGCVYYIIWRMDPQCFLGFHSFLSAFLFSIETQNTIGYGSHAIGDCWLPAWLVGIQCILAVLMEAIFLGIVFAKISHPKGRSRTIVISECACIARRDGIVKFMFRVADIRKRTAIAPKIHAVMYTWGPGHTTAEGEKIPVLVQPLMLHYLDTNLLLPVVVEHTIDERSPLYGHTSTSLEALGAEIVVTFEGHSELGDTFMTRQSYLPSEIHWGCTFVNVIQQAEPGTMQHSVDLSRFHDVEPLPGLAMMPPQKVSKAVVMGGSRRVPRARLGENTLLLADELVVTQAADGRWFLVVRVGDAYPSQMCSASIQMFFYRYSDMFDRSHSATPEDCGVTAAYQQQTYVHQELPLTRHLWGTSPIWQSQQQQASQQQQQQQGTSAARTVGSAAQYQPANGASDTGRHSGVNVLLRYPVVVGHEIGPQSPLAEWITSEGMLKDADAEIVVVASATQYVSSHMAMRSKVYSVLGSIRWGFSYAPCVVPPKRSPTGHAHVDWARFHDVLPVHPAAQRRSRRQLSAGGGGQQQQQQQSGPWQQSSGGEQWTAASMRGAPDAYSSQVSEMVETMTTGGAAHMQQQDGEQQHWQQGGSSVSLLQQQRQQANAAEEALEDVWERGNAVGLDDSSSQEALASPRQALFQQQQEWQHSHEPGMSSGVMRHEAGSNLLHEAGQQQVWPCQRVRQSGRAAAGIPEDAATAPADYFDEEHTFAVLPARIGSWKSKRPLSAVLDLFESETPQQGQSEASADMSGAENQRYYNGDHSVSGTDAV